MSSKTALGLGPSLWKQYRPFRKREVTNPDSGAEDALRTAKSISAELVSRFGARKVSLFGSRASGGFTKGSDIDLAAWGIPPGKSYKAVAFATGYSSSWKVDIVDAEDCPETLRITIEKEGVEL